MRGSHGRCQHRCLFHKRIGHGVEIGFHKRVHIADALHGVAVHQNGAAGVHIIARNAVQTAKFGGAAAGLAGQISH